jgi:hypothetical protein
MPEPIHVTWSEVTQAFHVGDVCQHGALPPLETLVNPPEEPVVPLGRDPSLRVPGPRPLVPPPLDKDGVPLEVPPGGLPRDPETGAPVWPPSEQEPTPTPEPTPEPKPEPAPSGGSRAERSSQRT